MRLLVAHPDGIVHTRLAHLPRFLDGGDLLVVNVSATRPAAVDGTVAGHPVVVHLSTALDGDTWVIEVRRTDGEGPVLDWSRVTSSYSRAAGAPTSIARHTATAPACGAPA